MSKKKNESFDLDQKMGEEISRVDHFLQKNKKVLSIVLGAVVVIVAGFVGFKEFIIKPQEKEAQELIFRMQKYFEVDSFLTVVNGTDEFPGAVEIADDYAWTKSGNLAAYYAGISYLQLGEYEDAIDYLKKFKSKDMLFKPLALGATGDAYSELGELEKAASYYMKAAKFSKNEFTAPYFLKKAAQHFEELKEFEKATSAYEEIRAKYKDAPEAVDIDKFINRARAGMNAFVF